MRPVIRRRLLTGLLAMPGVLGAGSPAWAQFSVSPVILPFEAAAVPISAAVGVRNDGTEPLAFRFYAGDFDQEETGTHTYHDAGAMPNSCVGRVTVLPDGAVLAPGERRELIVTMAPGAETCWSGLFVETRDWGAQGLNVGQRVMVKLYGIPPGSSIDGSITSVTARAGAGAVDVDLEFVNAGSRPLRPVGRVELRSVTGDVVAQHRVEAFSALPGRRRHLTLHLASDLPPGRYVAVPILDIGADDLVGGQAAFRVQSAGTD
jgi:hypothetical protein